MNASLAVPPFLVPTWRDVVQILLVALVIYRGLRFLVGTKALQIVLGLALLAAIYIVAFLLRFTMITYLLGLVFTYGAFAALVVFVPELRSVLARLGQSRIFRFFSPIKSTAVAEQVAEALERLSRNATGAIIAIERENTLDEYLASGTEMEARVSADLLTTLFTPYSPLHDGAVVVRGGPDHRGRVHPALTQQPVTDRSLGTRHRAALGLSEETDALVLVVSEESTTISLAVRGELRRGVTPEEVQVLLEGGSPDALLPPAPSR
jgi:TIGR00159 family protein